MAYVFNIVLACWVKGDFSEGDEPGEFLRSGSDDFKTLEAMVQSWNKAGYQRWDDVHWPCIPEHFDVYENLPDNWRSYDKAEVSQS
jgi:hypothetical protein